MRYDKIAPGLMTLVEDFQSGDAAALEAHSRIFGVIRSQTTAIPKTVVFVRADEEADFSALAQKSIVVNQKKGKFRTAYLPLDRLEELSEDEAVQRIYPTRYLKPSMDVASALVHVPDFRSALSVDGSGVVIGIIDSGIDGQHPAFNGRIHSVWDQTVQGFGVQEGSYGFELTGTKVVRARDTNGHGTHVAGICAGNDQVYGGVAPGVTLVVVRTDFLNAHIADGIRYVFRVAKELGLPAVVNLSLGGHLDAHDGSDPLSRIIDDESGPGRIVCCAAGNEGDDDIHARVTVKANDRVEIPFRVPSLLVNGQSVTPTVLLNGWYSGADELDIAVQSPRGQITPFQSVIKGADHTKPYMLPGARIRLSTPEPSRENGDHQFIADIHHPTQPRGPENSGVWKLHLRAKTLADQFAGVRVDVWALDDGGNAVTFRGSAVSDDMKIGSPGSSESAVTVASFTCRIQWTDVQGFMRQVEMQNSTISSFSSEGPLRNGNEKPDVAAPGAMIVSAKSSASSVDPSWEVDSGNRVNAGTSMACPFVSGVVALLLQLEGKKGNVLDPDEVKRWLYSAARIPNGSSGGFDRKWGKGLIDLDVLKAHFTATA